MTAYPERWYGRTVTCPSCGHECAEKAVVKHRCPHCPQTWSDRHEWVFLVAGWVVFAILWLLDS